jgi:hypothetical protein
MKPWQLSAPNAPDEFRIWKEEQIRWEQKDHHDQMLANLKKHFVCKVLTLKRAHRQFGLNGGLYELPGKEFVVLDVSMNFLQDLSRVTFKVPCTPFYVQVDHFSGHTIQTEKYLETTTDIYPEHFGLTEWDLRRIAG